MNISGSFFKTQTGKKNETPNTSFNVSFINNGDKTFTNLDLDDIRANMYVIKYFFIHLYLGKD
jgi:hypothetical protein